MSIGFEKAEENRSIWTFFTVISTRKKNKCRKGVLRSILIENIQGLMQINAIGRANSDDVFAPLNNIPRLIQIFLRFQQFSVTTDMK